MFKRILILLCGCLWMVGVHAAEPQFVEGRDYALVTPSTTVPYPLPPTPAGQIQVIEFFSYECPWCNKFEPALEAWLKSKPKNVVFLKVPVAWNPEWELLAKAYYTAQALQITDKITPLFFKAIHEDQQTIATPADVKAIFIKAGVKADDFDNAFQFSPGIDAQISRGRDLLQYFGVVAAPTLVIGDRYKTDSGMLNGDINKMTGLLDFLVKKLEGSNKDSQAKDSHAVSGENKKATVTPQPPKIQP